MANSDLYFDDENIRKLDEFIEYLMSNPSIAIAGMRQKFFDGKYQQAARLYFSIFDVFQPSLGLNLLYVFLDKFFAKFQRYSKLRFSYIDGAFLIINSVWFDAVDGFDEDYPFYAEEVDLCFRVRKLNGLLILNNGIYFFHRRGGSSRKK